MFFYFLNKYKLKILENKFLNLFKYNISTKILHELLYLGFEYSFIYNYSLTLQDFSNFVYILILYKSKINNIYNNQYYEYNTPYINIILNNYYYSLIFNKIQIILNNSLYYNINPIYSNLHLFFQNKIKIKYSQLQQLVSYKGYVSNIKGFIYDKPIINNYINELNIYEYILACYGSKKGIIDTALKTADSGYLTKRLVNVTHNMIIKEFNCNSPYIFKYTPIIDIYGNILWPINLLKYKILQNNIINKYNGKLIYNKNIYLTIYIFNNLLNFIFKSQIYLYIKSLYLCLIINNICNTCLNYLHLYKYNLGNHIGIISSSAIGEPGTQMILRTFHSNSAKYITYKKMNIFKQYIYKFKIIYLFKIVFKDILVNKLKSNLFFMFNKCIFKNSFKNILFKFNKYFIFNQIIYMNYIYNSISKYVIKKYNKYTIIKTSSYLYKYYYNMNIQLLIKNIHENWIIYNLYTYYLYYHSIKLYTLFKKGIIYYNSLFKKYNLIYILNTYFNYISNFYYYNNILYNYILDINMKCIYNKI